jgi:hypothetical protein
MSEPSGMEGIYYSHVVPRDPAILTLMGLVFDKVHFPGAYFPSKGFDLQQVGEEIARLEQLPRDFDTAELIGILKFLKHVPALRSFCEFQPTTAGIFSDQRFPPQAIMEMYDSIYGPRPEGWTPMISSGHSKGLPGGDESISYRGEFHQFANAIYESARTGIPLINDIPGLPVFSDIASPVGDAHALAGLLSVLCMKLILPEMPVLAPADLMEFREESKKELRAFRRSMLTFAADLNQALGQDSDGQEIEKKAKFFVETTVSPQLDELRETISKPKYGWITRSVFTMLPTVGAGYLAGGMMGAIATFLTSGVAHVPKEFSSDHKPAKDAKKNGLYYLLKAESKITPR